MTSAAASAAALPGWQAELQQVLGSGLAQLAGLPEVVALGSRLRRHGWPVEQAPPPRSTAKQHSLAAAGVSSSAGPAPTTSQLLDYMVGAASWCCTTACSSAQATVGAWLLELGPSKAAHAPEAAEMAR
jgi:hypothetical protein